MRFAILALAFLACAQPAAAADGLKVELETKRDQLRVSLVNASDRAIRVETMLEPGPASCISDLTLDMRDGQGQTRFFALKTQPAIPKESDWRDLGAGERAGRQLSLDWLAIEYELEAGAYDVTATYYLCSHEGRVLGSWRSNTVPVTVEGDYDFHMTRMKQRGEMFEVDLRGIRDRRRKD